MIDEFLKSSFRVVRTTETLLDFVRKKWRVKLYATTYNSSRKFLCETVEGNKAELEGNVGTFSFLGGKYSEVFVLIGINQ